MHLPKRIFFTGIPGSRWSGIAQILEDVLELNTSDRRPDREYSHEEYSGHKGAYFGTGMELSPKFGLVDEAHGNTKGTRLIKSHEWSMMIDQIVHHFPNDGMILVYRNTLESFQWWKQAGGFDIMYPSYAAYQNDAKILTEMHNQNMAIETFCLKNNIELKKFDAEWIKNNFDVETDIDLSKYEDVRIAYVVWKNG